MKLGFSTLAEGTFEEVRERIIAALKAEGFGTVSEIDLKKTFAEKLGEEFRSYTILGACNPVLAKRAVEAMPEVGLLLPCNITVSEESGGILVTAVNPEAMMAAAGPNASLRELAEEATPRLKRAIAAL